MSYLHLIRRVWSGIVSDDTSLMQLIDGITVQPLELRAPGSSHEDAQIIEDCMRAGTVFGAIGNVAVREKLMRNLLSVKTLIPSLRTFCEDTKYLHRAVR